MMLGTCTVVGNSECAEGLGNITYYNKCHHYICKDLSCLQM